LFDQHNLFLVSQNALFSFEFALIQNMPPPLADDESSISSYTHRSGAKSSARQNAPVDSDIDTSLQIGVSKFGNFRSRPVAATPRVQETVQEPKTPQSTASIFMTSLELADSAPLPPPAAGITLQRKTTILNPSRQFPFGRKNSVSEPNRLRETFRSRGRLSSTVSQAVWPAITAPSLEPVLQEQVFSNGLVFKFCDNSKSDCFASAGYS
jgi:hypothetical protein